MLEDYRLEGDMVGGRKAWYVGLGWGGEGMLVIVRCVREGQRIYCEDGLSLS